MYQDDSTVNSGTMRVIQRVTDITKRAMGFGMYCDTVLRLSKANLSSFDLITLRVL